MDGCKSTDDLSTDDLVNIQVRVDGFLSTDDLVNIQVRVDDK
jgi:hypothetical protein